MRWLSHAAGVLSTALLASSLILSSPGRAPKARADATRAPRPPEPPEPDVETVEGEPEPSESLSIGRPNRGRLRNAVLLEESKVIRFKRGSLNQTWGTAELVGMLERAAARVARVIPGAKLTVGDLSRRRGGWLRPHRSHMNGRDVDIGFYALDVETGESAEPDYFVDFHRDGISRGWRHERSLRFDDDRNWELVSAMLRDERASVQYIFVSRGLRARILEAGRRRGAPEPILEMAAEAMEQPRRGGRHDDHFHVRIYCAPDDQPRCRDRAPFRSWHPLAEAYAAAR